MRLTSNKLIVAAVTDGTQVLQAVSTALAARYDVVRDMRHTLTTRRRAPPT
jgi:hypothetical protein